MIFDVFFRWDMLVPFPRGTNKASPKHPWQLSDEADRQSLHHRGHKVETSHPWEKQRFLAPGSFNHRQGPYNEFTLLQKLEVIPQPLEKGKKWSGPQSLEKGEKKVGFFGETRFPGFSKSEIEGQHKFRS